MLSSSVCAVIVSYNPSPEISGNIAALRPQVDCVVVVDNGSRAQNLELLRASRKDYDFELIENRRNLGIAAALNIGVREVKARGCSWAVLFDQDSKVEPGFIDFMLGTFARSSDPHHVGIICPLIFDKYIGMALPVLRSRKGEILSAMTSGSMIPVDVFDRLGTFNESLFIDYVDVEFCLRIRRAGFCIVESPQATLHHSLGHISGHLLLGRWFASTNHSAARRYYITRNRLWVLGKFIGDWAWSRKEARALITETIKLLLVEGDRLKKLKSITLGTLDAAGGRLGYRCEL